MIEKIAELQSRLPPDALVFEQSFPDKGIDRIKVSYTPGVLTNYLLSVESGLTETAKAMDEELRYFKFSFLHDAGTDALVIEENYGDGRDIQIMCHREPGDAAFRGVYMLEGLPNNILLNDKAIIINGDENSPHAAKFIADWNLAFNEAANFLAYARNNK